MTIELRVHWSPDARGMGMVRIQGETVVGCPVEQVFDFVADERNEPKYNRRMTHAAMVTAGPVGKGTRWAATVGSRGRSFDMAIDVTGYDRPRRLESTTMMSTAEIRGGVTFEPVPEGTRLRWSWDTRFKGILKLLTPVLARIGRRQEEETWAELKRYLEISGPSRGTERQA
ncbi:MAG TPA: SRPBCC family protein [Kribbella sp.]|nr:SRPBCC family protein [Kribbella sp.]